MAGFRNSAREFSRIAFPYFRSEDGFAGRVLLGTVIALQLFQVWLNVRFNTWYKTFYDALQNKDWDTFIWQLGVFALLAAFFIAAAVYQLYLQQWLQIRWRRWLTTRYLGRWLSEGTHYRMRLKGDAADNPDQRIADDIKQFINQTLDIGISLLGSIVTLISFVVILWTLSSGNPLVIGSRSFEIPGYLVWAALIYATLGTWVTHLVGRPLIKLNFDQQRYEADFRFSLVRLRENAEEVTLLSGEKAEEERLSDRFARVVGNWYGIMQRTKQLTFLTAGYSQVAVIFPFLVVSPLYFAGSMMLGGLMQIASAFGQVQGALSFFVKAYSDIADWKAVLNRLAGFDASIDWAQSLDDKAPRVEHVADGGATHLHADDLVVSLPNGQEIVRASDLRIAPPSGCWSRGRQARARPACSGRSAACGRSAQAIFASPMARTCWCYRRSRICRSGRCAARSPIPVRKRRSRRRRSRRCSTPSDLSICAMASTRLPIGPTASRSASSSGCRSHGRCCKSPIGCSSTRPRARSTSSRRPCSIGSCSSACRTRPSCPSRTARASSCSTTASSSSRPTPRAATASLRSRRVTRPAPPTNSISVQPENRTLIPVKAGGAKACLARACAVPVMSGTVR